MGADYYACSVIGVRVEEAQAYENQIVKAFEHNYPANWKVDPETGRTLWYEEKSVILPFPKWDSLCHDNNLSISYMESCQEKRGPVYAGICRRTDWRGAGMFTPFFAFSVEDLILNLKNGLEPLNLWNEANFGIWTFRYVSY